MPSKTIIAIWGPANQGKSTTIVNVANLIRTYYPNAQFNYHHQNNDIKVIITLNGKKIGIESKGDPNSRLATSLDDFARVENCDIILCSTRTSGNTVDTVYHIAQNFSYEVVWATNHRPDNNYVQLEALSAQHIFELLQTMMI